MCNNLSLRMIMLEINFLLLRCQRTRNLFEFDFFHENSCFISISLSMPSLSFELKSRYFKLEMKDSRLFTSKRQTYERFFTLI